MNQELDWYILFEGTKLPEFAAFLDVVASNKVIPEVDESVSVWFWHFSVCVGTDNVAPSSEVLQHSQQLSDLLRVHRSTIILAIENHFPRYSAEKIYDDWVRGLEIMMRKAKKVEKCTWTGVLGTEGMKAEIRQGINLRIVRSSKV